MQSQTLGNPHARECATIRGGLRDKIVRIHIALLFLLFVFPNSVHAQLTATEKLIQREVISLGGQWEGSDSCGLVSFEGKKFAEEHFEMLSHVRGIEWFHANGVDSSADTMRWLYSQDHLIKLDLFDCGELGNGLHFLRRSTLSRLEQFRVSNINLSDRTAESIASMQNLKVLSLEDVGLTPTAFSKLARCKKLEAFDAHLTSVVPTEVIKKLETELPKCVVTVTFGPGLK